LEHILTIVATWIRSVIEAGGYLGILCLMAIESVGIPLPSEVIMPFGGALTLAAIAVQRDPLSLPFVALAGALGETIGATVAYWVGATGGREAAFRYGKYVLLRRKDVERSETWFRKSGPITVFIARLLPVVRSFISLPAGVSRMPFVPFVTLTFIGSLPWCFFLAYVGVQFATHLDDLKRYFHGADAVIGVFLLAGVAFWIYRHLRPEDA
jgi:membrane protein DedA with SNARE-associated domain